jgi:hypothetical protein
VLVEASEAERPPPLFKDPDEMLAFTNQALAISDNPELRAEQIRTAFDFVMDNVHQYGWSFFDNPDQESRAAAMAAFVARAAAAWNANDPLFTPPGWLFPYHNPLAPEAGEGMIFQCLKKNMKRRKRER